MKNYFSDKIIYCIRNCQKLTDKHHNTYIKWFNHDSNKCMGLQLYNTLVFVVDFTGYKITVKNGGFNSQTTAKRINACFDALCLPVKYSYAQDGFLPYKSKKYSKNTSFTVNEENCTSFTVNFV